MSKKAIDFNKILLLDGAMGTMLQTTGMKAGELSESYNIHHPKTILEIHKEYVAAGADIITTNTFGANSYKLKDSELNIEDVIENGVKIAKASGAEYVALDIGPIGQLMEPYGTLSFESAYETFAQQIRIGSKAGADLILIETMSDIYEAKAAILAAKENSSLPILCSMTFQPDGKTLTGTDPITMVNIIENLGVNALGLNCSMGPKEALHLVEEILKYSSISVMVQPNAGLPKMVDNRTVFDIEPEEFADYIAQFIKMGTSIVGGCCGTTPAHIKAVKKKLLGASPILRQIEKHTAVSSSTSTVEIGQGIKIIGERINPTGKKLFKEALIKNNMEYILTEAINQRDWGAHILDVNVGLPDIDEKAMMIKSVKEIQAVVNLPLQIDSVKADVIEAAVRIYNGRPIINSVNGEEKVMEAIFPVAKKYGCLVVGLTLDEKGIPQTAPDRLIIAEKIVNKAREYGIDKEDLIIDCLVLTASAQQKEVQETIKALSLVKEKLGVTTTLGVSNVSFGLPNRELLNRTFLAMAMTAGLDTAIINPMDQDMMDTINAYNVLWNHDKESKEYIKAYFSIPKAVIKQESNKDLIKVVMDGLKEEAAPLIGELLSKLSGMEIVDNYLIPALDIVGKKYESGEIFLPQLIQSAETVKRAFEEIKRNMLLNSNEDLKLDKGKIVIATVKGDIHDIGKNIVKILLENYGFDVFDLGKDVPIEKVVEKVKEENVDLVGLSALMTTTVKNMEDTIKALNEHCPCCKVMVGGAVLDGEYADRIGADFYVRDARESVRIAQEHFKSSFHMG